MSVHIRYRFYKEKDHYLKDENMTRGYTLVEGYEPKPFHVVLKEFHKDMKNRAKVMNIWRTKAGEADYRIEEKEGI